MYRRGHVCHVPLDRRTIERRRPATGEPTAASNCGPASARASASTGSSAISRTVCARDRVVEHGGRAAGVEEGEDRGTVLEHGGDRLDQRPRNSAAVLGERALGDRPSRRKSSIEDEGALRRLRGPGRGPPSRRSTGSCVTKRASSSFVSRPRLKRSIAPTETTFEDRARIEAINAEVRRLAHERRITSAAARVTAAGRSPSAGPCRAAVRSAGTSRADRYGG